MRVGVKIVATDVISSRMEKALRRIQIDILRRKMIFMGSRKARAEIEAKRVRDIAYAAECIHTRD